MLLLALALVSCQSITLPLAETRTVNPQDDIVSSEPTPVMNLKVELADPNWDGERVPKGQQCNREGGENPSTPRILVGNIPKGSDAIVLEFSDRDYGPMDNGGHGKFGFLISEGTSEIVIPSFPGHTFDIPESFFLIQGAYLPPCSGGIGHSYYVTVKAVELISIDEKLFNVLDQGILELGTY